MKIASGMRLEFTLSRDLDSVDTSAGSAHLPRILSTDFIQYGSRVLA
jgi:hypothetical protein